MGIIVDLIIVGILNVSDTILFKQYTKNGYIKLVNKIK